jgi:hypothetical protein
MKKYMNVLCVLILALTLIDLVSTFFVGSRDVSISLDPQSLSLGTAVFLLVVALVALAAVIICFVTFIKFILNVNRNEVFTKKNISLLRRYGISALLSGVCMIILIVYMGIALNEALTDCLDTFIEGFFALLMGEVFSIGLKMQEGKNTTA